MHTHQAALLPRRVSVCVCVRERGYYNMRNGNNQHTHSGQSISSRSQQLSCNTAELETRCFSSGGRRHSSFASRAVCVCADHCK